MLTVPVDPARIRADVERLPGPRNRIHAPEAMVRADETIIAAFREARWKAERVPFAVMNAKGQFDYGDGLPTAYTRLEGANIVAVRQGASPDAVVVLAHHDTWRDSPGANDNTASVAVLLELARVLGPHVFEKTVMLVAADMEEVGRFGSQAFVSVERKRRKILAGIVFETMGYYSSEPGSQRFPPGFERLFPEGADDVRVRRATADFTLLVHRRSGTELTQLLASSLRTAAGAGSVLTLRDPRDRSLLGPVLGLLFPALRNLSRSDHAVFWRKRIPVVWVTDTANFRYEHYHRMTDTSEKLDYRRLAAICAATAAVISEVAGLRT